MSRAAHMLPPGPQKMPRAGVVNHQRQRILGATAQAVKDHGFANVPVYGIARAAGVSLSTFYEQFPNKSAVLIATIGEGLLPADLDVRLTLGGDLADAIAEVCA